MPSGVGLLMCHLSPPRMLRFQGLGVSGLGQALMIGFAAAGFRACFALCWGLLSAGVVVHALGILHVDDIGLRLYLVRKKKTVPPDSCSRFTLIHVLGSLYP